MRKITVGIDPDVDKSGFAIYSLSTNTLELKQYDLSDLFIQLLKLKFLCESNEESLTVRLEAGHAIKKTWGRRTVGAVKDVGRNNEIGSQIEKFLLKNGFIYELIPPCGLSSYSHELFCKITKWNIKKLTNPEKRVAGLLAYKHR
ncbi:hypothetical protein [Sphingobacterium faecium]|uniref:hypothetical protein n=1 Tax=Sphingobacterium faecium TaxID=34087 RepID=UPI0024784CC2|nr:hypothetical protein [Sphingobacterium faecium]WGQ15606.1 hypothetical protein QG727_04170 [Sphingobacterium faecium]